MNKTKVTVSGGTPFLTLLTVLFIGLKLCNQIDWSWWWVLSPMWLPVVVVFGGLAIGYVVIHIASWIIAAYKRLTRK